MLGTCQKQVRSRANCHSMKGAIDGFWISKNADGSTRFVDEHIIEYAKGWITIIFVLASDLQDPVDPTKSHKSRQDANPRFSARLDTRERNAVRDQ